MGDQEEKFHKLKRPAAIDTDGYFVESPKLWEKCKALPEYGPVAMGHSRVLYAQPIR